MRREFLSFLKLVEGNEYRAYVPPVGQSGVTIGIGVDIGNLNPDRLDIDDYLKDILRPYFRLRGDNARYALLANPLNLSREEVDLISMAAIQLHLEELRSWYNRESAIAFDDLHVNKQTVLLSVKYQYGNLPSRTPKFWRFATSNDWRSVYLELRNFGDRFVTRRNREADLIEFVVRSGGTGSDVFDEDDHINPIRVESEEKISKPSRRRKWLCWIR